MYARGRPWSALKVMSKTLKSTLISTARQCKEAVISLVLHDWLFLLLHKRKNTAPVCLPLSSQDIIWSNRLSSSGFSEQICHKANVNSFSNLDSMVLRTFLIYRASSVGNQTKKTYQTWSNADITCFDVSIGNYLPKPCSDLRKNK